MTNLSVMGTDGSIRTLELDGLSNYVPQKGEVIMFDGRVEDYNFEISGSDIILTLPNGEELVLTNMADMLAEQDEENPTKLTIASGDEGDVLVLDNYGTLTEIMEAAAAGAEDGETTSSRAFAQSDILNDSQEELVSTFEDEATQAQRRTFIAEEESDTQNIIVDNNTSNRSDVDSQGSDASVNSTFQDTTQSTTTQSSTSSQNSDVGDTTSPNQPTIDSSAISSISNDDTPTISGSAEAGSSITLNISGETYTTTTDENGNWSIEVDPLDDGEYTIEVTATDPSGNTSETTSSTITIDTSAEAGSVTIDTIAEDDIINASESQAQTISVSGTATGGDIEAGDEVTVSVNGKTYTTQVQEDGSYLVEVATADLLADNSVEVDVVSTDEAGNSVTSQASKDITVDTDVSVPSIVDIKDINGDMSEIVVSGTSDEVGNTINLYDQNGNTIGSTTVLEDGSWSIDVSGLANNSDFTISATQTDSAGNESASSQEVNIFQSDYSTTNTYSSDDYVFTGSGNDSIKISADDNNDNLVIDGGDGYDTVKFTNKTDDITVDLSDDQAETIGDDTIELRNIEDIYGGKGDDTIIGDDGSNLLYGDAGSDSIDGGAGNDYLYGGSGDDTIEGGSGNDILGGGNGNDILSGGAGDDSLHGQNGDDTIIGGAGNDTIRADGGTDTVVFSGNLEDYNFTYNSSSKHLIVEDTRDGSPDGTDDLYMVENIQFADQTVSTSIPDAPSVDLVSNSDTGASDTDNKTGDTTPTFSIALGTGVSAGYVVTLIAGDEEVTYTLTQEDVDNGYAEVTTDELGDGSYEVSATVTSLLGLESDSSSVLDVNIDSTASIPTASIDVGVAQENTQEIEVIDTDANSAAGIYERDGNYYQMQQTTQVDTVALRDQGYTIDSDGKFYEINEDGAKVLVEQEFTREVTHVVDAEPIMKTVTETTTYETLGEAHIDEGETIAKKSSVNFDFEETTSNIEIDFANFDTGTAKISFYDADGNQVGSTINTSHTNGAEGYSVPEGAVGVSIYNNTNSNDFEVETISYRGEPQTVTVEAGGEVPDYEAMEAAGIEWTETQSETIVQTADITKIGDIGNSQSDGFNPEDHETSQVFDFGPELANRMVTITVDMEVKGTWDNKSSTTNDYFSVSANGIEIDVNHYSNRSSGHDTDDVEVISSKGTDFTYEYEVYLDENGQVQLDFMVASTGTDEYVNVENINVSYEGQTGWVQEVTETETYTQSILVDAPDKEVDASEIEGGIPYIEQEVQVEAITTTQDVVESYTYPIDLSAALTDTDGSESLSVVISGVPSSATLSEGTNNGDGTWSIEVAEGETSLSESITMTVPANEDDFELSILATSAEDNGTQSTIGSDSNDYETLFIEDDSIISFDDLNTDNVTNLSEIDMSGGDSGSIIEGVELEDLLAITATNDVDEQIMKIVGDSTDTVKIDTDKWAKAEETVTDESGNQFDVYQGDSDSVKLYIDTDILVTDI